MEILPKTVLFQSRTAPWKCCTLWFQTDFAFHSWPTNSGNCEWVSHADSNQKGLLAFLPYIPGWNLIRIGQWKKASARSSRSNVFPRLQEKGAPWYPISRRLQSRTQFWKAWSPLIEVVEDPPFLSKSLRTALKSPNEHQGISIFAASLQRSRHKSTRNWECGLA